MRRILTVTIALVMALGTSASVAMAQDAASPAATGTDETLEVGETSFAKGLDAPATYFTERGDPVATMTVVDVERGWEGYGQYYEPEPGIEYVAVTFEIDVVSRSNLVVKPYDLSLIDGLGRNNSRSYVDAAEDSDVALFDDDAAVASGETVELTLVFELYQDTQLGYFMWQPGNGIIVLVDLTEI